MPGDPAIPVLLARLVCEPPTELLQRTEPGHHRLAAYRALADIGPVHPSSFLKSLCSATMPSLRAGGSIRYATTRRAAPTSSEEGRVGRACGHTCRIWWVEGHK